MATPTLTPVINRPLAVVQLVPAARESIYKSVQVVRIVVACLLPQGTSTARMPLLQVRYVVCYTTFKNNFILNFNIKIDKLLF